MADPDDEVPPSPADAALLRGLAAALGPDRPPDGMTERAGELLAVAGLDVELAALLDDAAGGAQLAGTRSEEDAPAPMVFVAADGSVEIEIAIDRDGVHGQLIGAASALVTLERASPPSVDAPVGALGRFRFAGLPPGPARLRVPVGDRTVATGWFVV